MGGGVLAAPLSQPASVTTICHSPAVATLCLAIASTASSRSREHALFRHPNMRQSKSMRQGSSSGQSSGLARQGWLLGWC